MNDAKKIIYDLFDKIIPLEVREIKLGYGSFVTIGFGKEISYELKVRGKMETRFRPEWKLWVYMCFWELKKNDELFCHSEEDKVKMSESLKSFEGKKLLKVEILDDNYSMNLEFEEKLTLHLIANNDEDDNEQWMLFTPDKKVLTAGPLQEISYEES